MQRVFFLLAAPIQCKIPSESILLCKNLLPTTYNLNRCQLATPCSFITQHLNPTYIASNKCYIYSSNVKNNNNNKNKKQNKTKQKKQKKNKKTKQTNFEFLQYNQCPHREMKVAFISPHFLHYPFLFWPGQSLRLLLPERDWCLWVVCLQ